MVKQAALSSTIEVTYMDVNDFLLQKQKELGCDENGLTVEAKLKILANALDFKSMQSDKLGYNSVEIRLADTILGKIYEAQKVIKGTFANPFEWKVGMWLIPTGCYLYQGKKYAYIGVLQKADENDHPTGKSTTDLLKGWREWR